AARFSDPLEEYRVVTIAIIEPLEQGDRLLRLLFVPEIDEVELEVGFAADQLAFVARLQHFAQPHHAIAARKEEQPSKNLRRGRRDGGVVVIEADAEVRIVQCRIELKG